MDTATADPEKRRFTTEQLDVELAKVEAAYGARLAAELAEFEDGATVAGGGHAGLESGWREPAAVVTLTPFRTPRWMRPPTPCTQDASYRPGDSHERG